MRQVGVLEAKTNLSALLDAIEQTGEVIAITRHGREIARLGPMQPDQPRRRQLSGPELLERSKVFRDQIARDGEAPTPMTWEDLKEIGRR